MNTFHASAIALAAVVAMAGCANKPAAGKAATDGPVSLVTTADTISYLIGNDIARSLKSVNDEIVLDVVFAGIKDRIADKEPRFAPEQERVIMEAFGMRMQQKQMAKSEAEATANLAEAKKFLDENGKKEGVITTASGLQYIVLKQGDGPVPASDSAKVKVNYEGTLLNGKVFDSSIKRGEPAIFKLNQVIKAWTEGVRLMKVGSKYKFFVHPDLAYGRRGMPHDIGPNTMLIFEIELLGLEK
jgi:FKBP-type peptidyl-prolyl cis-trans isomerase FkpA